MHLTLLPVTQDSKKLFTARGLSFLTCQNNPKFSSSLNICPFEKSVPIVEFLIRLCIVAVKTALYRSNRVQLFILKIFSSNSSSPTSNFSKILWRFLFTNYSTLVRSANKFKTVNNAIITDNHATFSLKINLAMSIFNWILKWMNQSKLEP